MPANLTPEYKRAEALFREAQSTEEKITALELMLQTIPKHKGTDHMQADLKRRLSKLRQAPTGKGAARHTDIFHVPRGTAGGQVAMLGTPNSGKSAIAAHLTNAPVHVAEFPFSTQTPVPGIMHHEDVPIQLVDMPPITAEHVASGQTNAYRQCDLILIVVDLAATDVTEQTETCIAYLQERTLMMPEDVDQQDEFYRRMARPNLTVATKADLAKPDDFETLKQLYADKLDMVCASANDDASLTDLSRAIFERLRILRVYSKLPGKPPDMAEPFVLPIGSTVTDLAAKVHRQLVEKLRYARAWGQGKHPGQQIPRDGALADKDVIELHFS